MTSVVGEGDDESPPMRTQMVLVHQRSGISSHAMETHWEESAPDHYTKHPRLLFNLLDYFSLVYFIFGYALL